MVTSARLVTSWFIRDHEGSSRSLRDEKWPEVRITASPQALPCFRQLPYDGSLCQHDSVAGSLCASNGLRGPCYPTNKSDLTVDGHAFMITHDDAGVGFRLQLLYIK